MVRCHSPTAVHTCNAALDACQLLVQVCIDGLKHQTLTPQIVYLLAQLLVVGDGLQEVSARWISTACMQGATSTQGRDQHTATAAAVGNVDITCSVMFVHCCCPGGLQGAERNEPAAHGSHATLCHVCLQTTVAWVRELSCQVHAKHRERYLLLQTPIGVLLSLLVHTHPPSHPLIIQTTQLRVPHTHPSYGPQAPLPACDLSLCKHTASCTTYLL